MVVDPGSILGEVTRTSLLVMGLICLPICEAPFEKRMVEIRSALLRHITYTLKTFKSDVKLSEHSDIFASVL